MLPSYAIALVLALAFDTARAAPRPSPAGQTIALTRRTGPSTRTYEEWGIWAKTHRDNLVIKYGGAPSTVARRGEGTNLIVNQNLDSAYYGSLAVGTPPTAFNVILDTGSADLWLADTSCTSGCSGVPTFNPSQSSSFQNLSTAFSITYGSGQASGVLAQDTIQMAGFSVTEQVFAVCDTVSSGLLNSPVSGLMGLAFSTIAASRATPFWESLVQGGAWDSPLMSFQLTRFTNATDAQSLEPGGTFTMGFVNQSLYTGDIDYQDIPSGQDNYWLLEMSSLSVGGSSISLPSGSGSYAAIDTGTTLVGGPSSVIAALYAEIPGSAAGTGNYEGYYTYPCSTSVTVSLAFGGQTWTVSPADFQQTTLQGNECLGAFFDLNIGSSSTAPAWIVGDTFLKNVYSVFRYNPASVGFAALSSDAIDESRVGGAVPSPTLGSVQAGVTATGATTGTVRTNGAQRSISSFASGGLLTFGVMASAILGGLSVFLL